MAKHHNPRIVTDGLVLCLDAANKRSYPGSGTTWFDLSGNGNNGTLVNGVGFNGDNGGGLVFDGTDDYIDTSLIMTGTDITFEVWFKADNQTSSTASILRPIMIQGNFIEPNEAMEISILRNGSADHGKIRFTIGDDDSGTHTTSQTYNDNIWHQAVLTKINTLGHAYIDNVLLSSVSGTSTVNTSTGVQIGGSSTAVVRKLLGSIGISRVYNRALTPQEIRQNFNATKSRYGI
jgi:hypothetical protein